MYATDDYYLYDIDLDIKKWSQGSLTKNSVLVFPPFNSYRRFLIHQVCETVAKDSSTDLATFSIGTGDERRTVVCHKSQFLRQPQSSTFKSSQVNELGIQYLTRNSKPKRQQPKTKVVQETIMGAISGEEVAVNSKSPPKLSKSVDAEEVQLPELRQPEGTTSDESSNILNEEGKSSNRRQRRPDLAVYVPRAKRSLTTPPSSSSEATNHRVHIKSQSKSVDFQESSNSSSIEVCETSEVCDFKGTICNQNFSDDLSLDHLGAADFYQEPLEMQSAPYAEGPSLVPQLTDDCDLRPSTHPPKPKQQTLYSLRKNQKNQKNLNQLKKMNSQEEKVLTIETAAGLPEKVDKEEKELRRASQEINRSNRKLIKQTFSSDILEIDGEKSKEEPEEDDWDAMFDDNGDCLDPKMLEELTAAVGKVTIEKPKTDYKVYHTKQELLRDEEFPHVLEVSNFPVEFKTQDLMTLFHAYKESGFDIKWVDDFHALAVFSSSKIAAEVLAMNHSFISLKPLKEATLESRAKAKKCGNSLQPYKQRPETCASLARRLVSGALGIRLKTATEDRENEKKILREAKEKKLLAMKQREESWNS